MSLQRTSTPVLRGVDLVRRFGQTDALRGVGIEIARGEIVAIMGPSGSGKSTLLHCLAGILRPDGGSVEYDGQRIDQLAEGPRSALRRTAFGFVFQFGQLIPELTAQENVALPLLLNGVAKAQAMNLATEWLARVGVAELAGRRPGEMSGGQGQRVAVGRSLVSSPRVVFADEPTGALDSLAGEQVMELLTGCAREDGLTVVLVTHEPRVAAYADREIIIRDGLVAAPAATIA